MKWVRIQDRDGKSGDLKEQVQSKCIGGVDKEGMIDTSNSGVDQESFLEVQASLVLHTAAKD